VDRLACVDLPALPLQLLLRRHPDWASHPVAVVEEDRPQGLILWVNERARKRRVRPGQRYAEGLSLAADLHAAVVPRRAIDEAERRLTWQLRRFSPGVEPWPRAGGRGEAPPRAGAERPISPRAGGRGEAPPRAGAERPISPRADKRRSGGGVLFCGAGLFLLDASGLDRLHPSLESWARSMVAILRDEERLRARVVVGFSRFGSYALVRDARLQDVIVCASVEEERRLARDVPLDRLAIQPRLQGALHKLGVDSVGELVQLPPGSLLERFGPEAQELHALATGDLQLPLAPEDNTTRPGFAPEPEVPVARERADLDDPELETTRLLFLIKHRLHGVLATLAGRGEALRVLHIVLELKSGGAGGRTEKNDNAGCSAGVDARRDERLVPAEPTLDAAQLADLVRLRLEAITHRGQLGRGVTAVELTGEGIRATKEQLLLFAQRPRRDLRAANRALARLRADLGTEAVTRAVLRDRHLPEARFAFEPLEQLDPAKPEQEGKEARVLVRRFSRCPTARPTSLVAGPHVLAGGWWGVEVHREYHYARTRQGDLLWLYYDRRRRRWVLQGKVE
jgi:protein ImuB